MKSKWKLDFYHIKDLLQVWEENDRPEIFREMILKDQEDFVERLLKAGETKLAKKVNQMVKETLEEPVPMSKLELQCRIGSRAITGQASKVQLNSNY